MTYQILQITNPPYRYFDDWRGATATEISRMAGSMCETLATKLMAVAIGSRGLFTSRRLESLIQVRA